MAADQEVVNLIHDVIVKSFFSWDTWRLITKVLWPLGLMLVLLIYFRIFIEPKIFWRINKWKKRRREKWEREYKDKK
jgi:hypothetical protein